MGNRHLNPPIRRLIYLGSLVLFLILNSCSLSQLKIPRIHFVTPTAALPTGQASKPSPSPSPAQSFAAITFTVALPSPLLAGEVMYFSVVDEVTGLGLNPTNYVMQGMDALHYIVTITFRINSVITYRYMRQGKLPILEDNSLDKAVRYRLYHVTGPGSVDDVVSAWADSQFNSPSGRVKGQILDSSNNTPIPNILIVAGGQQTLSDSAGNFTFEALPAGTHNLVAFAMDGAYQTFQQGARVEVGKSTQVNIRLTKAVMIKVIFTVSVPGSRFKNLPMRLAGNLTQLGDMFGDLQGGLSMVAARMPLLTPLPDGRYSLTLTLPVGADIRYKYTLGDGLWNAEHAKDGMFVLRQLVVPTSQNPFQVQDVVSTWQVGTDSPILFELNVAADTPASDGISIQFNPYGWTEPIPMWSRGNHQWVFQLYSPLNILGDLEYRYCRNDQCGIADEVETASGKVGRTVTPGPAPQDLQDTISGWTWSQPEASSAVVDSPVTRRASGFWAGMEFLPANDPTWQGWIPSAIQDVKSQDANWLVLEPTWSISRTAPLVFSPVPGSDSLWADDLKTIGDARSSNLSVALFPAANLPVDAEAWWQSAARDPAWWEAWFNRYSAFAVYHADLATKAGVQALILGGDWLIPALPGGQVNGASSGVPDDAETRWEAILADVREHFAGQVLWAVSYSGSLQDTPIFLKDLDGIYVLWNAPLSGSSVDDLKSAAGQMLDNDIKPFQSELGKTVILAVADASVEGGASKSLQPQALFQPGTAQGAVDLQSQADVYQGLLAAVNERAWLGGFVSRGYYPPVALEDGSASVHGKPAEDVLKYWFGGFLGTGH